MSHAPSVLVLDDGELDLIHRMLKRIGADYLRLQGRQIGASVERPRDLLITSGPRAFECPDFEPPKASPSQPTDPASTDPGVTWVCVHGQDFLPLRERLRRLGVHLLIHTSLDEQSLRLLLLQLLHHGPERRGALRLPLGGNLSFRVGSTLLDGRLAEISSEMCRIFSTEPIALDAAISVFLPAALGGGEPLELQGHALRSVVCESRGGTAAYSTVVRVNDIEPAARMQLEKIIRGEQIGTRVTPLADRNDASTAEESQVSEPERRREPRRQYHRRVDVLDFGDGDGSGASDPSDPSDDSADGLGHDLSTTGVRVMGLRGVSPGDGVTLALYGGRREEPAVVDATVVRDDGEAGIALSFLGLSAGQRAQIEKLMGGRPALESLQGIGRSAERVVVTRVTALRSAAGSGSR